MATSSNNLPMSCCGEEDAVHNVNKNELSRKDYPVNKPIVNKINQSNETAKNRAIADGIMDQILGPSARKRKIPSWQSSYCMGDKNRKNTTSKVPETARPSASFFNLERDKVQDDPPRRKATENIKKVLPLSQPLNNESVEVGEQPQESPQHEQQEEVNLGVLDDDTGDPNCPICREEVEDGQPGICCSQCKTWFHRPCLHMTEQMYEELGASSDDWFCMRCLSIRGNRIKWGEFEGEQAIRDCIKSTYEEIIKWRKNLFLLPRGKAGTDFIKELTRLLYLFIDDTKWFRVALSLVHIFLPMMLQKPSSNSKARENAKYLEARLKLWSEGKISLLMKECKEIQTRLAEKLEKKKENKDKAFTRLMLLGKIGPAMKYINNEDQTLGVHPLNETIKNILQEKHPKKQDVSNDILLPASAPTPHPVIFEEIDATKVHTAALHLSGSGGPTLIDADGWKRILCSKAYGNASMNLCQGIADLAKKLCREEIHPDSLHEFVGCRLIPLNKGDDKWGNPGVRPIGIGEILRRLVGKVVVGNIRDDIIEAAGPLQTCAGLKAGIEASIHAMREIFEDEETEAVLLVDAENAFNQLNRGAALHNIKEICPSFHRYLANTYQLPARLIINGHNGEIDDILSEEGSTQGDVPAMAMYAIGTKPLLDKLGTVVDVRKCRQVWYADDSGSGGKIIELKKWWDELNSTGPKFGYYPKPSKTIMIVKNPENLQLAQETFGATGIKIGLEGERHLGAVVGKADFKEKYVKNKVDSWIQDVEQLSDIAKDEPQIALSAFTKALCMRWCFVQRTMSGVSHIFQPLENAIRDNFIPAIIGRKVSEIERRIIALPVRFGGIGILNPVETSDIEYETSVKITSNLKNMIVNQEKDLENYDENRVNNIINKSKQDKGKRLTQEFETIKTLVDDGMKRNLDLAREKGSGSWLTALPVQALGYVLNKQEFRDSLCLRYGWRVPQTSQFCNCGKRNDVNHALTCTKGGYVYMRHNRIRDLEANILKDVCKDVRIEPELMPIGSGGTESSNASLKARLDVSAIGIWGPMERTFLDVRVVHPNCPSYVGKKVEKIYEQNEKEKKRVYNQRIIQVEKASFTPLVFTTSGGMAPECTKFHKKVAQLISLKTKENYPQVMNHLRTRLRFTLLKSTLIALRGERGASKKTPNNIGDLSFNMMPEMPSYEV